MVRLGVIIAVIVILPLVIMGIQPTTAVVSVTCDDFSEHGNTVTKELKLNMWKDNIEVSLCTSPGEGSEWRIVNASYKTVWVPFQQNFESPDWTPINREFKQSENSDLSGSTGQEIWTFPSGNGTISMEYAPPGDGGSVATRSFTLSVIRD